VVEVRSPAVRRRELGALLRALRMKKGLTVEQVAANLLCSPSKVSRMETGHVPATLRDIRDLCDLYGVTDESRREHMMQLALEGKQQGWWQAYDLPYSKYVGLEAEAVSIHGYQSSVVPGLLQTTDYARALHEAAAPRLSPDIIEQRVEVRLIRQQLFTRERPPSFKEVIDEAALHRVVGGAGVMRRQLERLIEACDLPNVTIQIVPFSAGAHPALESNFKILELLPPSPDVVYLEGLFGSFYLERAEELDSFRLVFDRLQVMALSPEKSIELIATVRDSMTDW
jgi:transcriptional regulator with XRE-family HTH domain